MSSIEVIDRVVERSTGLSVDFVRSTPLCELRGILCGRDSYGGVCLSDRIYVADSASINAMIDNCLRTNDYK